MQCQQDWCWIGWRKRSTASRGKVCFAKGKRFAGANVPMCLRQSKRFATQMSKGYFARMRRFAGVNVLMCLRQSDSR